MFCVRCGSEDINSIVPDSTILWCQRCGCTSFTDDLPEQPLETWDSELSWRSEAGDLDALRLSQRELLAQDLQERAEAEEEHRVLGTRI